MLLVWECFPEFLLLILLKHYINFSKNLLIYLPFLVEKHRYPTSIPKLYNWSKTKKSNLLLLLLIPYCLIIVLVQDLPIRILSMYCTIVTCLLELHLSKYFLHRLSGQLMTLSTRVIRSFWYVRE